MNAFEIALIAGVSLMGTAVAYLRNPEHKAFMLMLPVPFTLATLALGRPVDATNVLAMLPLFGFTIGVWVLYARLQWPIVPAIAACAIVYCLVGASLARFPLGGEGAFWVSVAGIMALAVILIRTFPPRLEPSHRTPLPVWIKLPTIALVIIGLVIIKEQLGGFMTMFPMVGVVAAYEARYSLWALVRRLPWILLMMAPMMAIIRITQSHVGLSMGLFYAWLFYLTLLWGLRNHYSGSRSTSDGKMKADTESVAL
jgi:hypothetical protein